MIDQHFQNSIFQNSRVLQNSNAITIRYHLLGTSHVPRIVPSIVYKIMSFNFHNSPVASIISISTSKETTA